MSWPKYIPIEVYIDTLYFLPYKDIINFCTTNKYANIICHDDNFWKNYIIYNYDPKVYGIREWNDDTILILNQSWNMSATTWFEILQKLVNIKVIPIDVTHDIVPYYKGEIAVMPYDKAETIGKNVFKLLNDNNIVISDKMTSFTLSLSTDVTSSFRSYWSLKNGKIPIFNGSDDPEPLNDIDFEGGETLYDYITKIHVRF